MQVQNPYKCKSRKQYKARLRSSLTSHVGPTCLQSGCMGMRTNAQPLIFCLSEPVKIDQ